jgi:hypothetical protein
MGVEKPKSETVPQSRLPLENMASPWTAETREALAEKTR